MVIFVSFSEDSKKDGLIQLGWVQKLNNYEEVQLRGYDPVTSYAAEPRYTALFDACVAATDVLSGDIYYAARNQAYKVNQDAQALLVGIIRQGGAIELAGLAVERDYYDVIGFDNVANLAYSLIYYYYL
ncbi:MAG: hypothetical protein EZS28_001853 [Streblomastix strix]|uniref:Uncharacterized protein n=1 Tax=Streblomastix strix TaxID=222440 RepID=A0A5J4X5Y4_9EUKA|nr:MAG: hypothetical protein EZS28_001853 [Streblomastix strix]